MKMKKLWAILFALCVLLPCLPMSASAADMLIYKVGANGYLGLNRYTGSLEEAINIEGTLEIPSSIEGVAVTSIADSTFYGFEYLRKVVVPPSVKEIGDRAFAACTRLTDVTINAGTVSLGKTAFQYCYSLKNISLPNTLTAIRDTTFSNCIALESITIPSSVTSIGSYAFQKCDSLTTVNMSSGITSIGDYAFSQCKSLVSISLPSGLTALNTALFDRCPALVNVRIPSSVKSIGPSAFGSCMALTSITVPEGVEKIHNWAFDRCSNLAEISMPDSVNSIAADSFYGCDKITFLVNAGSYSQVFASANNIPFSIGTKPNPDDPDAVPFTDISSHWAKDSIIWAYREGLFNGTSATEFSPNGNVTRAMFVTVLYRMEGEPAAGTPTFSDVRSNAYYAPAVAWAAANGIVDGTGNNQFSPTRSITREQFAVMLYRYATYKKMDVSASGSLTSFPDASRVANYAVAAMRWAVGTQLIGGKSGQLVPKGNTTRAEAATMLQRFDILMG